MCTGRRKKQIKTIKTTDFFFVCVRVLIIACQFGTFFPLKKSNLFPFFSCPFLIIVCTTAEKDLEANFLIIQKQPNML